MQGTELMRALRGDRAHARIARGAELARAGRSTATGSDGEVANRGPARTFTFAVRPTPCVVIEDAIGCVAKIASGRAWFTTEGATRDYLVASGANVVLAAGGRHVVSAVAETAVIVLVAPPDAPDACFDRRIVRGIASISIANAKRTRGVAAALEAARDAVRSSVRALVTATRRVAL